MMMRVNQRGFTLIELVVVIVILGILAATAVPRFTSLTDSANLAVAEGVKGAVLSAAVIQFGAKATGSGVSFTTIVVNTEVSGATAEITASTNITGAVTCNPGSACALTCDGGSASFIVSVDGQTTTGTIPDGLCEN